MEIETIVKGWLNENMQIEIDEHGTLFVLDKDRTEILVLNQTEFKNLAQAIKYWFNGNKSRKDWWDNLQYDKT